MGVPGLQTWLRRRYGDAFVPLPQGGFDHVYIDMSSTLHQVIRRARTKQYFHYTLHRRLDDILAAAAPRKRVVLALDGPAPLAKLLEQRRRRRRESDRAARQTEVAAEAAAAAQAAAEAAQVAAAGGEEDGEGGSGAEGFSSTVDALGIKGTFRPPNPELSTLALTTGSQLMLEVHASLQAYICKKLADPATAHLSFELSDSTVKGEGELKILSRLLHPGGRETSSAGAGDEPASSSGSSGSGEGETHLVLGSDSDLLLMSMVSGQQGVYIVGDLFEDRRHKRPHHHRRQQAQPAEQLAEQQQQQQQQQQQLQQEAAALAASLLEAAGSADTESDTESGSDSEDESEESESEPEEPQLVVPLSPDAQPAAWTVPPPLAAEHAPPPPLMAFSQDALAALWREQHLSPPPEQAAGGSSGGKGGRGRGRRHRPGREQAEVTSLALDLMLLSVMANGDDYLPAIQGMQLSNKHRPGIWDLYLHMRQEPEWAGQWLVQRHCHCGADGGQQAWRPCPSVRLNLPMLRKLLADYYSQRYVWMMHEGEAGSGSSMEQPTSSLEGSTAGSMGSSLSLDGSLDGNSVAGSMDGGAGTAPAELGGTAADPRPVYVWNAEGLAAAAALAQGTAETDEEGEGGEAAGGQRRRRHHNRALLQGTEPQPDNYIKGLEWVLQMYSSGAVRDYRFAYDFMAPSLPDLLRALGSMQEQREAQQAERRARRAGGAAAAAAPAPQGSLSDGEQEQQGAVGAAGVGGEQPAAPRRRRSLQPLLPAACAMALLPRGGRMHAATALQHLMDEGSELEEIYAVCDECAALGQRVGAAGREIESVRAELVQLGEEASAANAALVQQLEAELERLRQTMSQLQRTQHEHLYEAHPYRPFPTEALEAAVAAVPLESYPQQERKLAQFGREFVYFRAPYPPPGQQQQASGSGEGGAGTGRPPLRGARRQRDVAVAAASGSLDASLSSVGSDGEEEGEPGAEPVAALMRPRPPPRQWAPMHAWVRETLAFVAAYPRLADPWLIRRANSRVQREVLPLRPYMQPPRKPVGDAKVLSTHCQERQWRQAEQGLQQRRRGTTMRQHAVQPQQAAGLHTASFAGSRAPLCFSALPAAGLHTASFGSSRPLACAVRSQLPGASAMRAALVQAGTRLLGNLRMLRVL